MSKDNGALLIEDARIIFRNFAGKEGQYNREGDRNFCVLLDDETAQAMVEDDWNIKYLKPREEEDAPEAYIQVSVRFDNFPPRVVTIGDKSGKRTELDEDTAEILDYVSIANVDLMVNPYKWEVNGKGGVKAYLKSIYVTIEEDYLDLKYANVGEDDG